MDIAVGWRNDRLVVVEKAGKRGHNVYWRCRCDCGGMSEIAASNLRRTRSCGCLHREVIRMSRGGRSHTREWHSWKAMIRRCENSKCKDFKNYGGRGITVSSELRDFDSFLSILGPCPRGLTLDRIDVNGNYEQGNVRWTDSRTQNRNRRDNRRLVFDGRSQTLTEWAEESGIDIGCIQKRLKYGWPIDMALTHPSRGQRGGRRIYRGGQACKV